MHAVCDTPLVFDFLALKGLGQFQMIKRCWFMHAVCGAPLVLDILAFEVPPELHGFCCNSSSELVVFLEKKGEHQMGDLRSYYVSTTSPPIVSMSYLYCKTVAALLSASGIYCPSPRFQYVLWLVASRTSYLTHHSFSVKSQFGDLIRVLSSCVLLRLEDETIALTKNEINDYC